MIFMDGNGTALINAAYFERFLIVEKADAFLIVASRGREENGVVTLARYRTSSEAFLALDELNEAFSRQMEGYRMPRSTGPYRPEMKAGNGFHGRKNSGHGGS